MRLQAFMVGLTIGVLLGVTLSNLLTFVIDRKRKASNNKLPDTPLGRALGEPSQDIVNEALKRLGNNTS